jgi:transposase
MRRREGKCQGKSADDERKVTGRGCCVANPPVSGSATHPSQDEGLTQPGVGPNTALAFVLTLGEAGRFQRSKQVASYLGLIPREESSGGRQKLGAITKQGNRLVRSLLVEAAQIAVRYDPGLRKQYLHRCHQKPKGVAKVAAARKLAVRLYWMLRTQVAYPEIVRIESSPRVARVGAS